MSRIRDEDDHIVEVWYSELKYNEWVHFGFGALCGAVSTLVIEAFLVVAFIR